MKFLFSFVLLLIASASFGQAEKTISSMAAGTKLSSDDIGFLSMVSNADVTVSRGAGDPTAKIGSATYKAGQVLTAADSKSIQKAIKSFQKTYKAPSASRGAGLCYYWYYYCDGYGYCYWYKYWYYC